MASKIQRKWRHWWYDDLDKDGISKFVRFSVDKSTYYILHLSKVKTFCG
jgi:hypothetical protein